MLACEHVFSTQGTQFSRLIQKLSIYFELKRYLNLKNICYQLNIDYFFMTLGYFLVDCFFEITLMFIETVLSSTFYQVLLKVCL